MEYTFLQLFYYFFDKSPRYSLSEPLLVAVYSLFFLSCLSIWITQKGHSRRLFLFRIWFSLSFSCATFVSSVKRLSEGTKASSVRHWTDEDGFYWSRIAFFFVSKPLNSEKKLFSLFYFKPNDCFLLNSLFISLDPTGCSSSFQWILKRTIKRSVFIASYGETLWNYRHFSFFLFLFLWF